MSEKKKSPADTCPVHQKYQAKQRPRVQCEFCWELYWERNGNGHLNSVGRQPEKRRGKK